MATISDQTVVCSRHFKYTDFKWTPAVRKTLKSDSVPFVFDWSNLITPRRELFKHPVPQKRPRPESDTEIEADDDISLGCEPYPEFQETNLIVCSPQKDKIQELEALVKSRDQEIQRLQKKIEIERFGINRFSTDNTMILFYTGFVSMSMFSAFFNFIKPVANSMTSYYYKSNDNAKQNILAGRQRNMLLIDELFMFLCRLKCGLMEQDLAVRFNCHVSTVSRKMITWANFLYFVLGSFNIWPSKQHIDDKMPASFKLLYPSTRVVIDCTEIKTERPSSLALGSKCYSNYKSSHTWKGLVGIAPHGAVTFISSLYTGCMSDVEITKLCGLVDLLEMGDSIMADKGFVLNKVLEGTGITVNTPPFLMSHGQFTKQEVEETQTIAKLRIHIERHIRRVKEYHLFDKIIPLSMVGTINQLWTVANMLTLFRGPLVKEWH
ncbi:Hypothetical predicted protein [Mytilus galloprovincialis]|uniref:THAP-type domain-containing protein n=1 Tax=Mytilus galloprovincialis TaxID=29158 RepID=A0A8B6G6C5_MYTGA|nr:Hypothetical predicted protein [Mytilus galloprovincialis]